MTEIQLSEKFTIEFAKIQKRAEKGGGESKYLIKLIDKGIAKLIENHGTGQKIQKQLWPKEYVQKYGIRNLWRLRLDDYWRLIYTIIGEKIRIYAIVLDVLNHKDYNKKFGYK